jgi:hypothetical protein
MTDHDDPVEISPGRPLRISADSLRALRKASGRSMSELMADDEDEALRFQVMGFAELYRRYSRAGHLPDAGELWERAGLVELVFLPEQLDPTNGEPSTTSPPSADIGA